MKLANRHVFMVGGSGSGKSTAEVKELVEEAKQNNSAIVCIDPHGPMARDLFAHLCSRGLQDRVIYDRMRDLDRVLKWEFLSPSRAKNPHERKGENQTRCEGFAEILLRRRGQSSAKDTPNIEKWLLAALNLYIYQRSRTPLADIRYAFSFEHPKFHKLLEGCTDEDTRYVFEEAISKGNTQYEAAAKIIDGSLRSVAFHLRTEHSGGFDFERHLNNKGIVIVEGGAGGALSEDAMITMMGAIILKTLNFLEERGRMYPHVILSLDEATNYNLIGEAGHEVKALATHRKFGLAMHIMVQKLPSYDITTSVMTNCATRKYFKAGHISIASVLGADLGRSYTTEGTKKRVYREDGRFVTHEAPAEIDNPYADELLNLDIGEYYLKQDRHKEKVQGTMLPAPFGGLSDGDVETVLDGCLNKLKQRPEYYSPGGAKDPAEACDSPTENDQILPNEPPQQPDNDSPFGLF